jgi:hypothetical protein
MRTILPADASVLQQTSAALKAGDSRFAILLLLLLLLLHGTPPCGALSCKLCRCSASGQSIAKPVILGRSFDYVQCVPAATCGPACCGSLPLTVGRLVVSGLSADETTLQHVALQRTTLDRNAPRWIATLRTAWQHTTLHRNAPRCNVGLRPVVSLRRSPPPLQHSAARCNAARHVATQRGTLQRSAERCNAALHVSNRYVPRLLWRNQSVYIGDATMSGDLRTQRTPTEHCSVRVRVPRACLCGRGSFAPLRRFWVCVPVPACLRACA